MTIKKPETHAGQNELLGSILIGGFRWPTRIDRSVDPTGNFFNWLHDALGAAYSIVARDLGLLEWDPNLPDAYYNTLAALRECIVNWEWQPHGRIEELFLEWLRLELERLEDNIE